MMPLRFGHPASALYGVLHPAVRCNAAPHAVLMCNPFGQEAVRIHRLFRVLADRLARECFASLRFDYYASGESLGEDEEADLNRWVADIRSADALLRRRSGAVDVTWIAPRLAAVLAARASATVGEPPRRIVFWEPVTDGATYLRSIMTAHEEVMASLPDQGAQARDNELIGFGVSSTFVEQIRSVSVGCYRQVSAGEVIVLSRGTELGQANLLRAALEGTHRFHHQTLDMDFDWISEEAINTALVPATAIRTLSGIVQAAMHG